jgi:hypothetical protein
LLHQPLLLLLMLLLLHLLLLLLKLLLLHLLLPTRSNPSVSCKSHPCGGFFLALAPRRLNRLSPVNASFAGIGFTFNAP